MRWAVIISIGAGVLLGGCVSSERQEQARFASFRGMSMAEFMAQTLVTPRGFYDVAGGVRVFVAEKGSCSLQLEARSNGKPGAEGWIIENTRRVGGCDWI